MALRRAFSYKKNKLAVKFCMVLAMCNRRDLYDRMYASMTEEQLDYFKQGLEHCEANIASLIGANNFDGVHGNATRRFYLHSEKKEVVSHD